jgi:4-amino-4-deoxy-L-arabinose transferase-like glycosyltransferase
MSKRGTAKKKVGDRIERDDSKAITQIEPFYKKAVYLVLSAIVLLGFLLRFFDLGKESLWLDEAVTYYNTNATSIGDVLTAAYNDRSPPLHFIALWGVRLLGSSEFWLRFPSACAGIVTIVVIFFLAREIADEKAGLISALLLAVSPFAIYYSQEARFYAFAVFFVTVAYYAFFKACKSRQWYDWALFGVACAAAFYSHFYTGFATITLFIGYFIIRLKEFDFSKWSGKMGSINAIIPNDFKLYVFGGTVAFLLVIPIIGSFLHQNQYWLTRTFNWGLSFWSIPFATFSAFSFSNEIVAIFFIILMIAGLWMTWRLNKYSAITLGFCLFVPVIISMYLSSSIPFNVRYHMYLITIFLVIVGIGIGRLVEFLNKDKGVYAALVLIILLSVVPLSGYYSNLHKEDWRGFSANLQKITQPGDIIVPLPGYMVYPLQYYYSNQSDKTFLKDIAYNEAGFKSLENETGSVYFVVTWDIQAADPSGYSLQYLKENAQQQSASIPGINLLKKVR